MSVDEVKYLTPADVVKRYNGQLSLGTLANWRCQGAGPKYLKLGGKIFYPANELEAWENARTAQSTAEYRRA